MVRGSEFVGLIWTLCSPCSLPCACRVVSIAWMWLLPAREREREREREGGREGEKVNDVLVLLKPLDVMGVLM